MQEFKQISFFPDEEIKQLFNLANNKSETLPRCGAQNENFIDSTELSLVISNLHNEELFLDSVSQLLRFIMNDSTQVLNLLSADNIFHLYQQLTIPEARISILLILILLLQYDSLLNIIFTEFIETNILFFSEMVNFCLTSEEIPTKIVIIHFLKYIFRFQDACLFYLENDIFELINSILTLNEELDFHISLFYKYISKFKITFESILPFYQAISPSLFQYINHPNPEIAENSLSSIYHLLQSTPLPYYDMIQNSYLYQIVKQFNHPEVFTIRKKAFKLIKSCFEFDDFPITVLFEYGIVNVLFQNLQNDDESFALDCISFIRLLIQKCNNEEFLIIVDTISQFDCLTVFSNQSLSIKHEIVDIFVDLCEKSTLQLTQKLMTPNNIEFLLEVLSSGEVSIAEKIAQLLIQLIVASEKDENFESSFYPLLNELNFIQQLESFDFDFSICPKITTLLELLKTKLNKLSESLD